MCLSFFFSKQSYMKKRELHKRLCRCERKLKKLFPRSKSIGICVKSVLHRRGYTHRGFKCRGKGKLKLTRRIRPRKNI